MRINRRLELGIEVVEYLANNPGIHTTKSIASALSASSTFLEQINSKLAKADVLKKKRGPGGGFGSCRYGVTVYDVARALNEGIKSYSGKKSYLKDEIQDGLNEVLLSTIIGRDDTLADFTSSSIGREYHF